MWIQILDQIVVFSGFQSNRVFERLCRLGYRLHQGWEWGKMMIFVATNSSNRCRCWSFHIANHVQIDDIQQLLYVFVVFFFKRFFFGCVFACSADACAKTCTPRRLWRSSRFTATRTLHKRVALSYAMERLYILRCKIVTRILP